MIKAGDKVTRMLAGTVPMDMVVAAVDDKYIYIGAEKPDDLDPAEYAGWKFDKTYGYEVDEDLGWGRMENGEILTGSYLVMGQEVSPTLSPLEVAAAKIVNLARSEETE